MALKVAVQMDPVQGINIDTDTTCLTGREHDHSLRVGDVERTFRNRRGNDVRFTVRIELKFNLLRRNTGWGQECTCHTATDDMLVTAGRSAKACRLNTFVSAQSRFATFLQQPRLRSRRSSAPEVDVVSGRRQSVIVQPVV